MDIFINKERLVTKKYGHFADILLYKLSHIILICFSTYHDIYTYIYKTTRACLTCIFNIMAADDLATQGARSSAVMILTWVLPEYSEFCNRRVNIVTYEYIICICEEFFFVMTKASIANISLYKTFSNKVFGRWEVQSPGSHPAWRATVSVIPTGNRNPAAELSDKLRRMAITYKVSGWFGIYHAYKWFHF